MNALYVGDCLQILPQVEAGSVDLIFADPPFNIGLRYKDYKDKRSYENYCIWCKEWLALCYRVLTPTGTVYIAIGDDFAAEMNLMLKAQHFHFRNWIIWHYSFGQHQRKKFSRSHTHILYFTKNPTHFTFNDQDLRIPSARQTMYKDKRAYPQGKIPDDVWTYSRVCGNFKERIAKHPCQMPEDLLKRIILASSHVNDLVLDPFGGTGTTAAVAKKLERRYITMDISKAYVELIRKRLGHDEAMT